MLNLYTGAGQTLAVIDDLEIAGFVGELAQPAMQAPHLDPPVSLQANATAATTGGHSAGGAPIAPRQGAKLNGSVLTLSGRPFFPRVIEYQGEPLAFLKDRGFNAARSDLAIGRILAEAARRGSGWSVRRPCLPGWTFRLPMRRH